MATLNREKIWDAMEQYRKILEPNNKNWQILEIGIDGDDKPSGNYKYFGEGNEWKTLDFLPELKPDIVADITDTKLPEEKWDLIICSQVIEHIFNFPAALKEIYRILKKEGYAIIDCPFEFPYHGLPSYDDYWRISSIALSKILENIGFKIIKCQMLGPLTTCLAQKLK